MYKKIMCDRFVDIRLNSFGGMCLQVTIIIF